MKSLSALLVLSLLVAVVCLLTQQSTAQEKILDCSGTTPNTIPFYTGEPRFVNRTTNGKRYVIGEGDDQIHILHLYGSPVEMGRAMGQLMGRELKDQLKTYFAYLDNMIVEYLKKVPKFIAKMIADLGLKGALDLNYVITKPYTPAYYEEEYKGVEQGSNGAVTARDLRRLNLLPELIKASCSIVGANGPATVNGTMHLVRALDWDKHAPINKYPTVVVYHPDKGNAFANIGYLGLIGSITGFSSSSLGVAEKVWLSKEGQDEASRFGIPWTYLLRDILQFANNMDDVVRMLWNAKRTCAIHLGIGDSVSGKFLGAEYSARLLNLYYDKNQTEYETHPRMDGLVYWDRHVQPSNRVCLGGLLKERHGRIDSTELIRNVIPIHQTGDTQSAVMDFKNKIVYLAYSAQAGEKGPVDAYDRQHVKLDMNKLFQEKL